MTSRPSVLRRIVGLLALAATSMTAGCLHFFYKTEANAVQRPSVTQSAPTLVTSPVRVHLVDGSSAVFRDGAWISHDSLWGAGEHYPLLANVPRPIGRIQMDSVIAVESFQSRALGNKSTVVSLAATAAMLPVAALGMVAIFGSCPTVYADTGAGLALQAEGFSYAIAPMFEHRDVDPLRVRPDANGVVRLELRNEALETHFINHVELLAVRHAANARIVPDQGGRVVALTGLAPITRAIDRAGRDVRAVLATADGALYETAPSVTRAARVGDLDDWIDLDVDQLPAGDSVAVVLRLRNSLLNTILLYEGMLGGRDAPDWLEHGLQRISTAVDLGRWYNRTMGMRAHVDGVTPLSGDNREGIARLGDVGPIAFRDVAIVLPRASRNAAHARIRLRFVADNWRIDEIRVAGTVARPISTTLPVQQIVVPTPADGDAPVRDTAGVRAVASADEAYLETRPSQRMTLVFERDSARRPAADSASTYLLAWQGWYREWIRGSWLANPARTEPFVPGDAAVLTALKRWVDRKDNFERDFYASRVPVR